MRRALDTLGGFPIERLWLDCEEATAGFSPQQIVAEIEAGLAACAPLPSGIYTGRWWWPASTGNSSRFAGVPLWHAEYMPSPNTLPDFAAFKPYGGWTRPAMWQFQGTTSVCGVSVDRNVRAFVPPPAMPPSPPLSNELALIRFARALVGGAYAFRAVADRPEYVELVRVEAGAAAAIEPPYLLRAP